MPRAIDESTRLRALFYRNRSEGQMRILIWTIETMSSVVKLMNDHG